MGVVLTTGLAACGLPHDASGTLDEVRGSRELRVGFSLDPPWVTGPAENPDGIEPALLRAWAAELGAQVAFVHGTESRLIESLADGTIHVVIGGHRDRSPWTEEVGVTQPFCVLDDERHVLLTVPGESAFLLALDRFLARVGCPLGGDEAL